MEQLKKMRWLDEGTEFVEIVLNFWNNNEKLFTVVELKTEVTLAGRLRTKAEYISPN